MREGGPGREDGSGLKVWLLGSALLLGPMTVSGAEATQFDRHVGSNMSSGPTIEAHPIGTQTGLAVGQKVFQHPGKRGTTRSYSISCVPYAREVSGIQVIGNAWQWWENASGLYARGDRPEVGSVWNFRANGRMRLGHV